MSKNTSPAPSSSSSSASSSPAMRRETLEQFLARKGKITVCEPGEGNATPLRVLRAQEEERAARIAARNSEETTSSEQRAERAAERFGAARGAGFSVSDALDESR